MDNISTHIHKRVDIYGHTIVPALLPHSPFSHEACVVHLQIGVKHTNSSLKDHNHEKT